jgi:cytidylate kinase
MEFSVLKGQDDRTSNAICEALKGFEPFHKLSEVEGRLIVQRDREDDEKLAVGIQAAIKKGVLPADPHVSAVDRISVVGKSADQVATEVLEKLGKAQEGRGQVIVLQGLSGTGKGTTVGKLRGALPSCVCWSNGNVFRSVTHLVSEQCDSEGKEFTAAVLTPELLERTMKRLSFDKFDDDFDVVLDGTTRVSTICNTVLKAPRISNRVPTVAEQTQGEVVKFAAAAVNTLTSNGRNVILEGRAQTLNYIPTPNRFELVIDDMGLLGERRAAQRVMAEAMSNVAEGAMNEEVLQAVKRAAEKLAL